MANLINSPRVASYSTDIYRVGLDRHLCQFDTVLGHMEVDSAAIVRAGQLLTLDGANRWVLSDGTNAMAMALQNKATSLISVTADEVIRFTVSGGLAELQHSNLVVGSVSVNSAALQGGTHYALTTDYLVNAVNGVITHVGLGSIPLNADVFCSYRWQLTALQSGQNGTNWFGNYDDVTLAGGKMAVGVGKMRVFTLEYDVSRQYALTGAGSNIYGDASGLLTNVAAGDFLGRVIQLPSAGFPYLGVAIDLAPVAA